MDHGLKFIGPRPRPVARQVNLSFCTPTGPIELCWFVVHQSTCRVARAHCQIQLGADPGLYIAMTLPHLKVATGHTTTTMVLFTGKDSRIELEASAFQKLETFQPAAPCALLSLMAFCHFGAPEY